MEYSTKNSNKYSKKNETQELFEGIAWGLLWGHTINSKEDVTQITPLFKYAKGLKNKKKVFRFLWFIDIPIGNLDAEEKESLKSSEKMS